MRILGIDPSLTCTGWALVTDGKVYVSGTIKTNAKDSQEERLNTIRKGIDNIAIVYNNVNIVAIEEPFLGKNPKVYGMLCKVQGVIIATLHRFAIKNITRYEPRLVKKIVTGHGNASKEQVLKMVKLQSGYTGKQLDESDAIAVALTCEREISSTVISR